MPAHLTSGSESGLWPTPTAHNAKETNAPSESLRNTPTLAAQAGGQLNPTWVEWLMNWPIGWTELAPLSNEDFNDWFSKNSSGGAWWAQEPINVPRTAHNIPARTHRLRCIGNGQVPAVVFLAWNLLI